jgi:hypothetical protein
MRHLRITDVNKLIKRERFTCYILNEILNYAEVSELMFTAKEDAKYSYLLEGFTFAEASELWFNALNK